MTNTKSSPEEAIAALGFTDMEAVVYCALLRGGPATGYRLAQTIGKAPANTYQALASLTQRGAVMVDESEAKIHRATPAAELLSGLKAVFEDAQQQARTALASLRSPEEDDRIYHLKTWAKSTSGPRGSSPMHAKSCSSTSFPSLCAG